MRHFCTLFDKNYLAKGLAMIESLKRHSSEEFTVHVLALDSETFDVLCAQSELPEIAVISLKIFEEELGLQRVRASRTWTEYCWTLASVLTDCLLESGDMDAITYLDADLFFFSNPKVVFDEIGSRSIGIIPHRLIPSKRHLEANGKFNVGWVTFRNTEVGRECLRRWAQQCRERCSATVGCGDQKYLDEWPDRYGAEVCIVENIGANVAPWNLGNYIVSHGPRVDGVPVCFYHFHEFTETKDGAIRLTNYELRQRDIKLIYEPYIDAYKAAKERIKHASASVFDAPLSPVLTHAQD
jgi:hypothetical protein